MNKSRADDEATRSLKDAGRDLAKTPTVFDSCRKVGVAQDHRSIAGEMLLAVMAERKAKVAAAILERCHGMSPMPPQPRCPFVATAGDSARPESP